VDPLEKVSPPGEPGKGAAASPAGAGAGAGKEKDEAASLREEIARLTKTNQQLTESERFWADKAQAKPDPGEPEAKPARGKAADTDEDLDDPAAFVEALSTKGPKAIAQYLKKAGYITRDEAEELATKSSRAAVAVARASLTQDAELVGQYPELKDEKSELFKATGEIYRHMVKRDPKMKDSPAALMQAAETAKLRAELKAAKEGKASVKPDGDDAETRRQERIDAQSGSRGRRSSAAFDGDEDDDTMGPETKTLLKAFSRYGVTEENFKAEKKRLKGAA
jgi:hypothetical protein